MDVVRWSDPPMSRKDEEKKDAPLGAWLRKKVTEKRLGTLDALRGKLGASSDTFYGWIRPHVAAVPSQKYVQGIELALQLNREERTELREEVLRQQQEASDANREAAPKSTKRAAPVPDASREDIYPSRAEAIELSRGKVDDQVLASIAKRRLKSDAVLRSTRTASAGASTRTAATCSRYLTVSFSTRRRRARTGRSSRSNFPGPCSRAPRT